MATVGFPNIGLQGFAPKLAKEEIAALSGAGDVSRYFQIRSLRTATMQPGIFADGHRPGGALVDERGNVVGAVSAKLNASARAPEQRGVAGECELRGEEQLSLELSGIRPRSGRQTERAADQGEEV